LIGAVLASGCIWPAAEIASDSAWLAWLVTTNMIGPAPTEAGDTDTLASLT
jgi:hypothetical protein